MPTIKVEPGSSQELQEIADVLAKSRKVVVITGAGISTNCGIPDFRSENGLYSLIQAQYEAAANIMPDSADERIVKRRRIDCSAVSPPADSREGRCAPQLPSRHSHSLDLNNTILTVEENLGQQAIPDTLSKSLSVQQSLPAITFREEPSSRRQLRSSRSLTLKGPTTQHGGNDKEALESRSSTAPLGLPNPQRQPRSSRSPQIANKTDLKVNLTDTKSSSKASSIVKGVSRLPRRLRSFKLLGVSDSTPEPSSLAKQPSKSTPLRRKRAVCVSRRQLWSSTSGVTQASLVEDGTSRKPKPTEESSLLVKDTPSIEVILLESPGLSQSEADSYIHAGSNELSSSQASTNSATSTRGLPNLKGKDLFDAIIWSSPLTTSIFYTFISSLRQKILSEVKGTTLTHKFIRVLRDGGRLVRNYTQNIDLLEEREGLCTDLERGPGSRARFTSKNQKEAQPSTIPGRGPHDRGVEVVHLHGKLDGLRCGLCTRYADWDEENRHQATLAGEAPECPWCKETNAHREGRGRRSLAIGRLRPDIVLYGEEHPSAHLVGPIITHDLSLGPDILLILGTSLRVHGLKFMVKEFGKAVHRKCGKVIFVNKTKPPVSVWGDVIDYWVEWDCDAWVEDLKERRKDIWLPQGTSSDGAFQEEKQKPVPKNPVATRPDVTNGAHLTLKIVERLGRLSGRLPDAGKPAIREPVPTEDSKKRKRASLPRPNSIRLNKENGAYLVFEIIANLRRLSGSSPQPITEKRKLARVPLASKSANLPSRRVGTKQTSTWGESSQCYLPTPPKSDQATPPLTPGAERFRRLGSISTLFSRSDVGCLRVGVIPDDDLRFITREIPT